MVKRIAVKLFETPKRRKNSWTSNGGEKEPFGGQRSRIGPAKNNGESVVCEGQESFHVIS